MEETDHVGGQKIAEHVLTILVNLSAVQEVLESLARDDAFLDTILSHVTVSLRLRVPAQIRAVVEKAS